MRKKRVLKYIKESIVHEIKTFGETQENPTHIHPYLIKIPHYTFIISIMTNYTRGKKIIRSFSV